MALRPVKYFWPFRLDPGEEISFTIEEEMQTADAIFDPMLRCYNSSGETLHLKIEHLLDLGFGDDPLYSGTYTYTVVSSDIPTNSMFDYAPAPQIDLDTVAATRNTVYIKNLDTVNERIVRFILFGMADISTQLPADQAIIRARRS